MVASLTTNLITRTIEAVDIAQRADDGFINATAMCKAVGKFFNNYSQTDTAQEFFQALAADTGIPVSGLIVTVKGGNDKEGQGTWVHPDVAVHLAQWCSPRFAVCVSKWVREWMETGRKPVLSPAKLPDLEETLLLSLELVRKNKALELQAAADKPKVEFAERVAASKDTSLLTVFAKSIHWCPNKFCAQLRSDGVLYYRDGVNIPKQEHLNAGRFEVKVTVVKREGMEDRVTYQTRITGKGQLWLSEKYQTTQSRN